MGLTIHYHIAANKDWTRRQIRQKLEETRRFALTLPVLSVSEVVEFRGAECDYEHGGREHESPDEAEDRNRFHWSKIEAGRYVESPWRPGESRRQAPSHMLCLSIYPAEGCEEMNVGCCHSAPASSGNRRKTAIFPLGPTSFAADRIRRRKNCCEPS